MRLNIIGDKYFYSSVVSLESSEPKMPRHRNPDGSRGGLVSKTAKVDETVYVGPNAYVVGTAQVSDNVRLLGHACVNHQAKVSGRVVISQNGSVQGNAEVKGNVRISGRAIVENYAKVSGDVRVSGNVMIQEGSVIRGKGSLVGNLIIGSRDVNMPWGPKIK